MHMMVSRLQDIDSMVLPPIRALQVLGMFQTSFTVSALCGQGLFVRRRVRRQRGGGR